MIRNYVVNEVFFSLQGEGHRTGTANVFVRMAGCNLRCSKAVEGFDCDTDFSKGSRMRAMDILDAARDLLPTEEWEPWVIFTGGEPALQVDDVLVGTFHHAGWKCAIETNGTHELPRDLDWISCSPKLGQHHRTVVDEADEVRCVVKHGAALPVTGIEAAHFFLSPAWDEEPVQFRLNLAHCIRLCLANPRWRLSTQDHKFWRVR